MAPSRAFGRLKWGALNPRGRSVVGVSAIGIQMVLGGVVDPF